MLIGSQEEQKEQNVIAHKKCAKCQRDLDYPRIVLQNASHTSYHVVCALSVASEIMTDLQAMLISPNATEMVKRIELTRFWFAPGPEEGSMAAAFREAARLRTDPMKQT